LNFTKSITLKEYLYNAPQIERVNQKIFKSEYIQKCQSAAFFRDSVTDVLSCRPTWSQFSSLILLNSMPN
ncbi:hypothetical protein T05_8171, partial [Trichinella murrelli]